MEHRRRLTMNWEGLGDDDDDDDRFFDSYNRVSTAAPVDLYSSSDEDIEDDEFEDSRMSFSSTVTSNQSHYPIKTFTMKKNIGLEASSTIANMSPDYNIWMASPGSIRERRKRLLHGMGLDENYKEPSEDPIISIQVSNMIENGNVPTPVNKTRPRSQTKQKADHGRSSTMPLPVALFRSRSDGDIIDSFSSFKDRKEALVGKISKQRLTRTYSITISTQGGARVCPYVDAFKKSPKSSTLNSSNRKTKGQCKSSLSSVLSSNRVRAFFLVKNLDTGKEFVVNGYDEDGMWNKFSDLQTGKQLTMEEFEKCVGHSPVVKELMRREKFARNSNINYNGDQNNNINGVESNTKLVNSYFSKSLRMSKRRGHALLKNIKSVANSMGGLIGEKERDHHLLSYSRTMLDSKPGKININSSSSSEWVKVRQSGKTYKDLSALHLCQEFQAHEGPIWTIKFSLDGHFLASAGEDKVIHVWEVQECEAMSLRGEEGVSVTPVHPSLTADTDRINRSIDTPLLSCEKKKGKYGSKRGDAHIPDYIHVPETVFTLSHKPHCSFKGHSEDVLDLSWSKSRLLLSSSMDKTVRLWDIESKACLKLFAHNDYVTCIQFNPTDDDFFVSGSLDAKVRIWSIPDRHVVNWIDVHEMVTAVAYTPDGHRALVGSHKGGYRIYNIQDCKLSQISTTELRTKKKTQTRKITGIQFAPNNPFEVLVTSADSRIRILDGTKVIYKFRGFRNTSSQIAASFCQHGRYVICASEDSQVYVWRHDQEQNKSPGNGRNKTSITTRSHECFYCKDVTMAIPWPGCIKGDPPSITIHSKRHSKRYNPYSTSNCGSPSKEDNDTSFANYTKRITLLPPLPSMKNHNINASESNNNSSRPSTPSEIEDLANVSCTDSGFGDSFNSTSTSIRYGDSPSISSPSWSSSSSRSWYECGNSHTIHPTAWGMVIVAAGLGGEIRCYQNFGIPRRLGRQANLFGGPP